MKNKIAIVSGGSRGLGQAIVEDLLKRDYLVATFSRSPTAFTDSSPVINENFERFYWRSVDGSNTTELNHFVKDITRRWGHIDLLINCAGVGTEGILPLMTETGVEETIRINLEMPIKLTRLCIKGMLMKGKGNIINITSINGIRAHSGVSVYSATKAGLDALTRSLCRELGAEQIRVNSVAPGYFESNMTSGLDETIKARIERRTPLGRLGKIKEIVSVVKFLSSDDSSFITGQTIVVDGGATC